MRLDEIAVRDHQLDELNVGKAVTGVAKGVGKAIGGVAKGIGAVAGGIAGIPGAVKKGFQAGKAVVSGDNDTSQPTGQGSTAQTPATAATGTQAQGQQQGGGAQSPATGTQAQGQQQGGALSAFKQGLQNPVGGGQPNQSQAQSADDSAAQGAAAKPADAQTAAAGTDDGAAKEPKQGQAAAAAEPAAQAQPAASEQPADKVSALRDRILKLDDASRQEIIKILQTQAAKAPAADQPQTPAANDKKSAQASKDSPGEKESPAAGKAADTASTGDSEPQKGMPAGRFGQEMGRLAKPLAGADSETPGAVLPQKAGSRPQGGGRVAGQLSTDPRAVKRREQRAAKKADGAAQPDLTDPNVPISAAIRQRQRQGLAAGYRNPNKMIREGFSLFRKQQ